MSGAITRDKIKRTLPLVARSVRWIKRRKNELPAIKRHLKRIQFQKDNRQKGDLIKVVFICQYIPAWSKNKQLYICLKEDERFKVLLLCVPNRISANKLINPDDLSNDVYDYFVNHGYKEAENALIGRDEWFDLEAYKPDYVIFNRYDRPMPVLYTSAVISTYAKICFIHYSTDLVRVGSMMFDKSFTVNTYCYFAEFDEYKNIFNQCNSILCKLNLSKAVYCGVPAIENSYKAKYEKSRSWDFSKNPFRIIYTPRWTMDPMWGGSSFLKYRDSFFTYSDQHSDIDILVRPHPLMFNHFIDSGIMNFEEVEMYKRKCETRRNINLDHEDEYLATFWNSNLLITDQSSIIIEYFVTEKPIIHLTYQESVEYTKEMLDILSACYIVSCERELFKVIDQLVIGDDPLKEKRKEISARFLSCGNAVSKKMKQFLLQDAGIIK